MCNASRSRRLNSSGPHAKPYGHVIYLDDWMPQPDSDLDLDFGTFNQYSTAILHSTLLFLGKQDPEYGVLFFCALGTSGYMVANNFLLVSQ